MIDMFREFPPVVTVETEKQIRSMPKAYQLIHQTATGVSYRSCGEKRKSEQHVIFHYTLRGCGEAVYKGTPYGTRAGEGFFNIINEDGSGYGYPADGTEPWEFIVICFDGGNVRQMVEELLQNRVVYAVREYDALYRMCKNLIDRPETAMTFFPRLVSMLSGVGEPTDQICTKFQKIVKRDLCENPTIAAIAHEIGVSREHLQREYSKRTGHTPAKYLNDKRFEYLCALLATSMREEEIAATMHFSSVLRMTEFFKRYTGITPRRYRKDGSFIV